MPWVFCCCNVPDFLGVMTGDNSIFCAQLHTVDLHSGYFYAWDTVLYTVVGCKTICCYIMSSWHLCQQLVLQCPSL
eukprot:8922417-Ditylum_brightwellii.AAC.1